VVSCTGVARFFLGESFLSPNATSATSSIREELGTPLRPSHALSPLAPFSELFGRTHMASEIPLSDVDLRAIVGENLKKL